MDLVARELATKVAAEDLVLVHPWYYGVSFDHHYSGRAPWTTLPALADNRYHRYDLLKVQLQVPDSTRPVRERVADTLRKGGRVWLVGSVPVRQHAPSPIRPAPDNPWGWQDGGYVQYWGEEMGHFLTVHSKSRTEVLVPFDRPVSWFENPPLFCFEGWTAGPDERPAAR